MKITPEIVIGIPGNWQTRSDIVQAIAKKSEGFLFAGGVLLDKTTQSSFNLEIYEHDPNLSKAFAMVGGNGFNEIDLATINSHTFTLYLINNGGSLTLAQQVLDVGCGLLKAGGLGVKVETTGKAHNMENWFALAGAKNETALFHAFVTLIGNIGIYYSCGMHNLGFRDAIIEDNIKPSDAARLLQTYLLYVLIEKPEIIDGHTFSESEHSPNYRLHGVPCNTYPSEHAFYNPYGMWQFEKLRGN